MRDLRRSDRERRREFSELLKRKRESRLSELSQIVSLLLEKKPETEFLLLSPLRSSYLSGNYGILVTAYDRELYLDLSEEEAFLPVPELREQTEEDLSAFPPGGEREKRRLLGAELYEAELERFFSELCAELGERLLTEGRRIFFGFGIYMERVDPLFSSGEASLSQEGEAFPEESSPGPLQGDSEEALFYPGGRVPGGEDGRAGRERQIF
ncbi:MAG: hypothetical protein ACFN2Z_00010 [Oribacterium sp.]